MNYNCYSLAISSEIALPELISSEAPGEADMRIVVGEVAQDGLAQGKRLGPCLWACEDALWLHVPGVARFLVSDGKEIRIMPEPGADEDSIRVFLLGSAFGALLFQRGLLVMHGNAVRIGDQCLICVGHSGVGKSTLAAGFMQRGYDVLADDVVPVNDDCHALPGFPRIKLWQDAADRLGIDTQPLKRIRPNMGKFNQPVTKQLADQPLPVRWVYVLGSHPLPGIAFEPILGARCHKTLRANTYRMRFLEGMALKAEHFNMCGKLAKNVRMARLTRPDQGISLDALIDRILVDTGENP